MNFRIRYKQMGGHVHMRVFVGESPDLTHGLSGELCMATSEFDAFSTLLTGQSRDANDQSTNTVQIVPEF